MKKLKYIVSIIIILVIISFIYNRLISPIIIITNHSNHTLKLYKSEMNLNSIEPTMEEVEDMFRSSTVVKTNSSKLISISTKYLFSDQNKLNISLKNETKDIFSSEFLIQNNGYCSYHIDIYDGYFDITGGKYNLCYKRLLLTKSN